MARLLATTALLMLGATTLMAATAANGAQVPDHARAACFKVWCYDAGVASLRGHAGVITVVKAIRRKPFAEWNTIYYHPGETDAATLLQTLRSAHCPKALLEEPVVREQGGTIARLDNPLAVRGDCLSLAVRLPTAATLTWTLPEGWAGAVGPSEKGDHAVLIQTPAAAAAGKHTLGLQIAAEGAELISWEWQVELVDLVK